MKTKNTQKEIELEFESDSEGDENRGWVVDKISARIDGEVVGYLKLAYISKQRYANYYPTIFNYMDQIKGHCIIPRPCRADISNDDYRAASQRHYKTFNISELRKFLNMVNIYLRCSDISRELEGDTFEELIQRATGVEKHLLGSDIGKDFKNFKTYFVDKPIDDYIRVEEDFQREGIAEHLYTVGVKWLESRGLPFYLSTLRQPEAEALAEKFRKNGQIRRMSNKREKFLPAKVVVQCP